MDVWIIVILMMVKNEINLQLLQIAKKVAPYVAPEEAMLRPSILTFLTVQPFPEAIKETYCEAEDMFIPEMVKEFPSIIPRKEFELSPRVLKLVQTMFWVMLYFTVTLFRTMFWSPAQSITLISWNLYNPIDISKKKRRMLFIFFWIFFFYF